MDEVVFSHVMMPRGFVYFKHEEALNGIARIHIPEDFNYLRYLFNTYGLASWIEGREKYQTYDEYAEDHMENAVTHETLHYLVLTMEGKRANRGVDYIDCTKEGYRCLR